MKKKVIITTIAAFLFILFSVGAIILLLEKPLIPKLIFN